MYDNSFNSFSNSFSNFIFKSLLRIVFQSFLGPRWKKGIFLFLFSLYVIASEKPLSISFFFSASKDVVLKTFFNFTLSIFFELFVILLINSIISKKTIYVLSNKSSYLINLIGIFFWTFHDL